MNIQRLITNTDCLPALPMTLVRLKEILSTDCSNPQDIIDVVTIDPVLTAEILRLSNRIFFSSRVGVATVAQAYRVVGEDVLQETIHRLVNSASNLNQPISCIDLPRFWRQSVDTALLAREISASVKIGIPENMFVSGLLLNLGELIFANQHPNLARMASIDDTDAETLPWLQQQACCGFTYAQLSSGLMKRWKIPSSISEPVSFVYNQADSNNPKEACVLYLAALAALPMVDQRFRLDKLMTTFDLKVMGCSKEQIELAVEQANLEGFYIFSMLDPMSSVI